MARNTLTDEQRAELLEMLAADFPSFGIMSHFQERGWPKVSRQMLNHYRRQYGHDLQALRAARLEGALSRGMAVKEARIAALVAHAEALRSIVWHADPKGRLWNEKAWRETLDDIAKETGGRVAQTDITSGGQSVSIINITAIKPADAGGS